MTTSGRESLPASPVAPKVLPTSPAGRGTSFHVMPHAPPPATNNRSAELYCFCTLEGYSVHYSFVLNRIDLVIAFLQLSSMATDRPTTFVT